MSKPVRLAILRDFPEEHWWSMDLAADMLLAEIGKSPSSPVIAQGICPPFRARFAGRDNTTGGGVARNVDRLLNRMWDYPRYVRRHVASSFDLFHIADHSYSQLVHKLPADRTGVFCHDIDTFRCLLDPASDPRPRWFRAMARRILRGMQKAAVVFHSTESVRRQIQDYRLIDPQKLVQVPYGVSPEYSADASDAPAPTAPDFPHGIANDFPFLLHVGSCIPRKRIDVLLDIFAAARSRRPDLRLIQVGGEWTDPQRQQLARLNIEATTTQIRGVPRSTIAWLYRHAALVLQPSEAEGFGLPVIEALACGATVLASDIPPLREVGGEAATYCPVGDVDAWAAAVDRLLADPTNAPPSAARQAQAAKYTWAEHARIILQAYARLA